MQKLFPKAEEIFTGITKPADRKLSHSDNMKTGKLNRKQYNVPREFARHRSLPARQPIKTLSYGHSIPYLTKHISRRQRKSRLANLRRLRSNPYIHCQRPLCQGRFRHQSSSRSVRSRLNNDRFMPVSISLGTVSQNQRCHQASYSLVQKFCNKTAKKNAA